MVSLIKAPPQQGGPTHIGRYRHISADTDTYRQIPTHIGTYRQIPTHIGTSAKMCQSPLLGGGHTHALMCTCTHTYILTHACMHTCMDTYAYAYACTHTCWQAHEHAIHTRSHKHTPTVDTRMPTGHKHTCPSKVVTGF